MLCYAEHIMLFLKKRHYFDSGSFTPIHKKASRAIQCVLQVQTKHGMGNPIATHQPGRNAKEYLELARAMIAKCYQTKKDAVVLTSGATESNLLAFRTAVLRARRYGIDLDDMHIIIGNEEHSSIYKHVAYFQTLGVKCTVAEPKDGRQFAPADITKHIRKNTIALSLQMVNSKHGTLQPIAAIARACREKHPSLFIHTDAAQATAYFNCSPISLGVDAVTIDSTKSFGPQGAGAVLFQKANLYAGLAGERSLWDLRPGTPSVALLYGFGIALAETHTNMKRLHRQAQEARNHIVTELKQRLPNAFIYGIEKKVREIKKADWKKIAPHLLCVSFPNTNHIYLATLLDTHGFSVSTGSACNDADQGLLRISVLPTTTRSATRALVRCIQKHLPLAKNL